MNHRELHAIVDMAAAPYDLLNISQIIYLTIQARVQHTYVLLTHCQAYISP